MTDLVARVIRRHLAAEGYFAVGDEILMGKYKNKRGRIVKFFDDERGVPSVEVEPIPKGRKQNKVIGLYKIWHLPERRTPGTGAPMAKEACIIAAKDFDGDLCLLKNRDRAYDAKLQVMHLEHEGVEMAFVLDLETGYLEGVNEHGIGIVNTTLMVVHDEAEGKKKPTDSGKKNTLKSKDGPKIFKALCQRTLKDAVNSLVTALGGIRGHTFVGDGKRLVCIEMTRKNPARVQELDKDRINTRTNHGVTYPEAGYTVGEDYISSVVRRWEAQKRLNDVSRPEAVAPALIRPIDDADSPFNPVRVTDKMRTTSQLLVNTTQPGLLLYLIPGHATLKGTLNLLPGGRRPKIPVRTFKYRNKMEDRDFEDFDGDEMKDAPPQDAEEAELRERRVVALYKSKKKVKSKDGDERVVYEYGPRQVSNRNKAKAERLENLRGKMKKLREKVRRDVRSSDETLRGRALAVALMDETYERPGNDSSASEGHYGVTTWKVRHVSFRGDKATVKYVGKSGVEHLKTVETKWLVKALKDACADKGKNSCVVGVTAADVNEYLKPFDVTAKDIRGLHANREMKQRLRAVRRQGPKLPEDSKERTKILKEEFKKALEETAAEVGHESSTLRSQYLVPGLEDDYVKDGTVNERHTKKATEVSNLALRQAAERGTGTERRILANALLAPVLVAQPRTWWVRNAPSLYRMAREQERPRPSVEGLRFPPEMFAMLWYEDEQGDRLPVVEDGASLGANTQHAQFPNVLRHSILLLNDDGSSSSLGGRESSFSSDLVTAMIRSGEWDAADAIMVAGQSCERCLNVLCHHYGLDDGYPFGAEEYWRAGTRCPMCEHHVGDPREQEARGAAFAKEGTKTEAEKEDEAVQKMLRPEPKKKPPRYDLRDNRTLDEEEEEDLGGGDKGDRDLSMKWNKVARRVAFLWLAQGRRAKTEQTDDEFQKFVKGKNFRHPDTSNDVVFSSLPSEEQTRVYQEWKGKQKPEEEGGGAQPSKPEEGEQQPKPQEEGEQPEPAEGEKKEEKKDAEPKQRSQEDITVDLDNARDDLEELEADIAKLRDDIRTGKQALKEFKKLYDGASGQNKATLEAKIKEQKTELRRKDDKLEEKQDDLTEAKKRVEDLKAERKDPTGAKRKLEEQIKAKRQEKVRQSVDKAQETMRGLLGPKSELPHDLRSQLEQQLDNLDDDQVESFSLSFAAKMKELTDRDPAAPESIEAANSAAKFGDLYGLTDPEEMADRLAQLSYATNVVANPMNIAGKPVGQTEMTDEAYGERAHEAFRQFQGLHPALRRAAVDRLTSEMRGLDPDTHRAKELNAILTGMDIAQIADTGEALPGRPQPSKGNAALIKKMVELGHAERMFKPVEDFFAENARQGMSDALGQLDAKEVADLVTGGKSDAGYSDLYDMIHDDSTPDVMREMMKDFLVQDLLNDTWGDRAIRDTMQAAGVADADDPEVRAEVLQESKRREAPRREQALAAQGRVEEAKARGESPDQADVELADGYFDAEKGTGLRSTVRSLLDTIKDKFKKTIVSPATAVLEHFIDTGDSSALSQETQPHPDERAKEPRSKEEREKARSESEERSPKDLSPKDRQVQRVKLKAERQKLKLQRDKVSIEDRPKFDERIQQVEKELAQYAEAEQAEPKSEKTDEEKPKEEAEQGKADEEKDDKAHGPGEVWKTEEGNWRAKNRQGAPKTFDDRAKAEQYAKGKGREKGSEKPTEGEDEGFSAEFKTPVEERGPTRFASVGDAWLARVRAIHPDDPNRPIVVIEAA
jgi:hypothetical protein